MGGGGGGGAGSKLYRHVFVMDGWMDILFIDAQP